MTKPTIHKRLLLPLLLPNCLVFSLMAYHQPDSGAKKRLKSSVGEIKDVSLHNRGDGTSELIATSDNQVEVSRQQLAPLVDTLKRNTNSLAIFKNKRYYGRTNERRLTQKATRRNWYWRSYGAYIVQVSAK